MTVDRFSSSFRYLALSILVLASTVLMSLTNATGFPRFTGALSPVIIVLIAVPTGLIGLRILCNSHGFRIDSGTQTWLGIRLAAILATAMAASVVIADYLLRYPEDINTPLPEAALFYPVIGFIAEIAFHVLPLTLLLTISKPAARRYGDVIVLWFCVVIVSTIEPTYQVVFEGDGLTGRDVYTWIHVFLISLLQLYVFRRYDFFSMYAFRIIYYLYWHILWGTARLEILF